jgi:hypothetical protein
MGLQQSILNYAEELMNTHMEYLDSKSIEECQGRFKLTEEERRAKRKTNPLYILEKELMGKIVNAISIAFSTFQQNGTELVGFHCDNSEVITPMELLSLVVWQAQVRGLKVAQDCLQVLQDQLGLGNDRPALLDWLASVRTFSLDDNTGQLQMDPNIQWVTASVHTLAVPSELSLPRAAGPRKCSDPPAMLISPIPASNENDSHLHGERMEYYLLQLVHQPQDSPLHSRYTSSLSNLVLSPMLPFVNDSGNPCVNGASRLYFLPVLLIRQSINHTEASPAISPASMTLLSSTALTGSSFESGLLLQLRCGESVHISPRLCTQLGSCGQGPGFGIDRREVESGSNSQLMIFFGALLMVRPHAGGAADIAEVWAVLSDSVCRWWVYRIDLSSPSTEMFPSLIGQARQSYQPKASLRHLLGPSAGAHSARLMDEAVSPTTWRVRCQEVWTAVLSWFYAAEDYVVPPSVMPSVEIGRPALPDNLISSSALPDPKQGRVQAVPHSAGFQSPEDEEVSALVDQVLLQRDEEENVEQTYLSDKTLRRSSRSLAHASDHGVHGPVSERSRGKKESKVDGIGGQSRVASNKGKEKAEQKVKSAAERKKEADREQTFQKKRSLRKEEEVRKQKEEKERARKQKEDKERARKQREEKEEARKQREEKEEERKRKRRESDRAKRAAKKEMRERQRLSQPEVETQLTHASAEAAEGVRTGREAVKDVPATSQQLKAVSGGRGNERKRKGSGGEEVNQSQGNVEYEDHDGERKSAMITSQTTPSTSAHHSPHSTTSAPSPSMTSGSSSTLHSYHPAASVDDMDRRGDKSPDSSSHVAQAPKRPASFWHLYMLGDEGVVSGHKQQMYDWFERGSYTGLNSSNSRDLNWYGPSVDIIAEFYFLRQTQGAKRVHPSHVEALKRSERPQVEFLAQSFVASVGLHDVEVQDGFLEVVRAYRMLTDRAANARLPQSRAHHIDIPYPWVKWKGITLTTIHGDRLNEDGNPIDNDLPSYPLGTFPELDMFRADLPQLCKAPQMKGKQGLSSQSSHKKIKTRHESTSASIGDHGRVGGGAPSDFTDLSELESSPTQSSPPDSRDLAQELDWLRAEVRRLKAQTTIGPSVAGSSASQPAHPMSDGDSPSSLSSSHPHSPTDTHGPVAPSVIPSQPAASRQPTDNAAFIEISTASSPTERLVPPRRTPSRSTTVTTLPRHYPAVNNGAYHNHHGPTTLEMVPADVMRMVLTTVQSQINERQQDKAATALAAHNFNLASSPSLLLSPSSSYSIPSSNLPMSPFHYHAPYAPLQLPNQSSSYSYPVQLPPPLPITSNLLAQTLQAQQRQYLVQM